MLLLIILTANQMVEFCYILPRCQCQCLNYSCYNSNNSSHCRIPAWRVNYPVILCTWYTTLFTYIDSNAPLTLPLFIGNDYLFLSGEHLLAQYKKGFLQRRVGKRTGSSPDGKCSPISPIDNQTKGFPDIMLAFNKE